MRTNHRRGFTRGTETSDGSTTGNRALKDEGRARRRPVTRTLLHRILVGTIDVDIAVFPTTRRHEADPWN